MTYIGKSIDGTIVSVSPEEAEIIKDALQLYTARLKGAASIAEVYYNVDCGDLYKQASYRMAAAMEAQFGVME